MSSKRRKESEAAAAAESIQISPSKQLAAGSRVGKRTGAPTHTTTQISLKNVSNISNNISNIETILDVDRALWMLVYDNLFVNLDSYIGKFKKNYYLYISMLNGYNFVSG